MAARAPLRIIASAGAVAVLAALTGWTVAVVGPFHSSRPAPQLGAYAAEWAVFAAATLLVRRAGRRATSILVLTGAVLVGCAALAAPPTTSTDAARYSWDGIVQDAGVSPYRDVPAAAALAPLRPDWLFPSGSPGLDGSLRCPAGSRPTPQVGAEGEVCTAINRPRVPTIYPPVAEAAFALVRLPVPSAVAYAPVQLLGLVATVATTALLLLALARRGLPAWWAALFAWCPLVAQAGVNDAHVDGLATVLTLGASMLVAGGRPVRGGALLGLAIATKLTPVLAAPALVRRRFVRVVVAAIAAVAAVYLPYVIASGGRVLGYLPGYLSEEGYDDGTRSALLAVVLPGPWSTVAAAALVAAVAVAVVWRGDPGSPWTGQLAVLGVALLALSPRYAWYALPLLPPIAMTGRWEWLAVALALVPLQLVGSRLPVPLLVLAAAVVVVAGTVLRARAARPRRLTAA